MEVRERNADFAVGPAMVATDIGLLPKDWQAVELGKVSNCLIGLTYSPADVREYGVLVLRSSNIQRRRLDYSDCVYVDMDIPPRAIVREGDVLVCVRNGSRELIGKSALIDTRAAGSAFGAFMAVLRSGEGRYLYHVVDSSAFRRQTEQRLGATINQITNRDMAAYVIPWPQALGERDAIAEALSDADALIESLSLLLAKKRQIKQGAMQELLTGKKRLPGFEEAWSEVPLQELFEFKNGLNKAKEFFGYGTPIVNYMDVFSKPALLAHQLYGRVSVSLEEARNFDVRKGDLFFTRTSETTDEIGLASAMLDEPESTVFSGFLLRARPRDARLNCRFAAYALRSDHVRVQIVAHASYTTRALTNGRLLGAARLLVPPYGEQEALADVLEQMDAELLAIEAKRGKVLELKVAMMQALLTGRIRLMQPASNVIPLPTKSAVVNPPSIQPAHNWQINEAVVIGVLAQRFGSEQFPLPRKRRVKLMYLLHRHAEGRAEGYLKKAAGPYDPNTKYKGPEQIALKNGYVRALRNDKYEGFVAGGKIEQAQRYFEQWYGAATLEWLERFHYRKTDELELLATVDMAMVDLAANGEPAEVTSVKRVIAAHPEWLPKLSRELFSDERIAAAIAECQTLFGG